MRIYLSGPMTGLPEYNFPAFREAATTLRTAGHTVVDPSTRGVVDGWEWTDYIRADLAELVTCEAIAFLPGWRHSRGALLEAHVARELDMTAMFL